MLLTRIESTREETISGDESNEFGFGFIVFEVAYPVGDS